MSFSVSVPELLSDLAADAAAITLDMPQGGYDRLHALIESTGVLPADLRGRITLIAVVLLASRLLKQNTGPLGPVAGFVREVGEDALREESKRILETALTRTAAGRDALARLTPDQLSLALDPRITRAVDALAPARSVVGDAIRSVNEFFFPWMRGYREVSS
jgi:hypothetical protein